MRFKYAYRLTIVTGQPHCKESCDFKDLADLLFLAMTGFGEFSVKINRNVSKRSGLETITL